MSSVSSIRPLHDWLLVELDERPVEEKVGSIIVAGSAVERVWTGKVARLGPGRPLPSGARAPMNLDVGDRVAFFRENLETQQGKQVARLVTDLADGFALLRQPDVLWAVEA